MNFELCYILTSTLFQTDFFSLGLKSIWFIPNSIGKVEKYT